MKIFYCIMFSIFGMAFGSFYNVLATRIPRKQSIIKPASHCEKCGHLLKWYELIPVFSFLFLKGRCRKCKTKLSWMYPASELICGLLFFLSFYSFGFTPNLVIALTVSSLFILVMVSDLNYMMIPDRFIVISSIIILLTKLIGFGLKEFGISLLYGLISFTVMFMIMKFGTFLFKKECLGGADVKLMFTIGLCLEPFLSLLTIILASVIALPVSLLLLYKNKENIIPFGPFIVVGFLIIFFTKLDSQEIINLLLRK